MYKISMCRTSEYKKCGMFHFCKRCPRAESLCVGSPPEGCQCVRFSYAETSSAGCGKCVCLISLCETSVSRKSVLRIFLYVMSMCRMSVCF